MSDVTSGPLGSKRQASETTSYDSDEPPHVSQRLEDVTSEPPTSSLRPEKGNPGSSSGLQKNTSRTKHWYGNLNKAVYGFRTAPREWETCFAEELHKMGFRRRKSDGHVYVRMF